jgi:hypothetical protein
VQVFLPLAINTPGSAKLLAELIRADERLRAAFPRIKLPLLITHGTGDKVAKAHGSQFFYDKAGDVLGWLNAHVQQPQAAVSL